MASKCKGRKVISNAKILREINFTLHLLQWHKGNFQPELFLCEIKPCCNDRNQAAPILMVKSEDSSYQVFVLVLVYTRMYIVQLYKIMVLQLLPWQNLSTPIKYWILYFQDVVIE